MNTHTKNVLLGLSLTSIALLNGCTGGGGGGGGTGTGSGGGSSSYGLYNSPTITANRFVDALNDHDGAPVYDESDLVLDISETERSKIAGQDDWFVIYDADALHYKAVSLQYIRALTYYDYYANDYSTAGEFRQREFDDIADGYYNGDFFGDDYEVVDLDTDGYFYGRESGFKYEDETSTTDVALMTAEKEMAQHYQQAANISYTYSVSIETAMSLVSLGDKVKGMLSDSKTDLTPEDQEALMGDIESLTGVTLEEMMLAGFDNKKKDQVIEKISTKIGTTPQALEGQLLPDLLGINL